MHFAPYQWRAGFGYLPASDSVPMAVTPVFAYPCGVPSGYVHQIAYAPPGYLAAQLPPPPPPPTLSAPKKKPAPTPPTAVKPPKTTPLPPSPPPSTIAPGDSVSSTKGTKNASPGKKDGASDADADVSGDNKAADASADDKATPADPVPADDKNNNDDSGTALHSTASISCPTIRPGVSYMFPRRAEHTLLHIFNKAAPVWTEKYVNQPLSFKIFKVATGFTVRNVVEKVLKKAGAEDCAAWAVSEVVERGGGVWAKVSWLFFCFLETESGVFFHLFSLFRESGIFVGIVMDEIGGEEAFVLSLSRENPRLTMSL